MGAFDPQSGWNILSNSCSQSKMRPFGVKPCLQPVPCAVPESPLTITRSRFINTLWEWKAARYYHIKAPPAQKYRMMSMCKTWRHNHLWHLYLHRFYPYESLAAFTYPPSLPHTKKRSKTNWWANLFPQFHLFAADEDWLFRRTSAWALSEMTCSHRKAFVIIASKEQCCVCACVGACACFSARRTIL